MFITLIGCPCLSGRATFAYMYGTGKSCSQHASKASYSRTLGDSEAVMYNIIKKCTRFVAVCYTSKKILYGDQEQEQIGHNTQFPKF